MEKPEQNHFLLMRYFLLVSIGSIIIASFVLGMVFRQNSIANLVSLGEDKNINVARVISNHIWPIYHDDFVRMADMSPEQMQTQAFMQPLIQDVDKHIKSTSIVKIKVYNSSGKTVFSTSINQIGKTKLNNKSLMQAIAGQVVTRLAFQHEFDAHDELRMELNVLSTYLPIKKDDKVVGVIEIYTDVTDLYNSIIQERNGVIVGVMLVLFLLYAIIFVFVFKADKIIKQQFREKQDDEKMIRHIAYHDSLTGLPNRELYRFTVESAIELAKRNESLLGILFIDLDRFKQINDSLGHTVGDALLVKVALRLKECVRASDTVARQGGDEFTILLEGITHVDEIVHVCKRINASISQSFKIDGNEMFTSASIGVTVYPFDDLELENLLKDADTAMYEAKNAGRNNYVFFSAGMKRSNLEQLALERDLRKALNENEYLLQYQPIIDLRKGEMIGVEALLRWSSQEYGIVAPIKFIPLLEETGVMEIVGEWVLRTACEKAKQWQMEGLSTITIAVNISMVQFRQMNFVATIEAALRDSQLAPEYLKIELTESMLMDQSDATIEKLLAVRAMGVKIEADDFGTGYSSLSYLKKLPVDILKIDRSFITDVHKSSDSAAIVTAIMAMAYSLKLDVIAEGVEEIEELKYLSALNCHLIQGYLFSKPLPEEELKKVMLDPDYFKKILAVENSDDAAVKGLAI